MPRGKKESGKAPTTTSKVADAPVDWTKALKADELLSFEFAMLGGLKMGVEKWAAFQSRHATTARQAAVHAETSEKKRAEEAEAKKAMLMRSATSCILETYARLDYFKETGVVFGCEHEPHTFAITIKGAQNRCRKWEDPSYSGFDPMWAEAAKVEAKEHEKSHANGVSRRLRLLLGAKMWDCKEWRGSAELVAGSDAANQAARAVEWRKASLFLEAEGRSDDAARASQMATDADVEAEVLRRFEVVLRAQRIKGDERSELIGVQIKQRPFRSFISAAQKEAERQEDEAAFHVREGIMQETGAEAMAKLPSIKEDVAAERRRKADEAEAEARAATQRKLEEDAAAERRRKADEAEAEARAAAQRKLEEDVVAERRRKADEAEPEARAAAHRRMVAVPAIAPPPDPGNAPQRTTTRTKAAPLAPTGECDEPPPPIVRVDGSEPRGSFTGNAPSVAPIAFAKVSSSTIRHFNPPSAVFGPSASAGERAGSSASGDAAVDAADQGVPTKFSAVAPPAPTGECGKPPSNAKRGVATVLCLPQTHVLGTVWLKGWLESHRDSRTRVEGPQALHVVPPGALPPNLALAA